MVTADKRYKPTHVSDRVLYSEDREAEREKQNKWGCSVHMAKGNRSINTTGQKFRGVDGLPGGGRSTSPPGVVWPKASW